MSLNLLKNVIDYDLFLSDSHEGMKSDISIGMMISFASSERLIEMKLFPCWMIRKSEIGFIMKQPDKEKEREEAEFSKESENESLGSEMTYSREILQLSGGSIWESNFSVCDLKSNGCFEIDGSVENIELKDFFEWGSLKVIIFRSDSHLRKIDGCAKWTSLCGIRIPSSVEVIELYVFRECTSLIEVIFSSESNLREIDGFGKCTSLSRIEIPLSVERIGTYGFTECTSLSEVSFSIESHLREIHGFMGRISLCRIEIA
jgi:hypothetical protein